MTTSRLPFGLLAGAPSALVVCTVALVVARVLAPLRRAVDREWASVRVRVEQELSQISSATS